MGQELRSEDADREKRDGDDDAEDWEDAHAHSPVRAARPASRARSAGVRENIAGITAAILWKCANTPWAKCTTEARRALGPRDASPAVMRLRPEACWPVPREEAAPFTAVCVRPVAGGVVECQGERRPARWCARCPHFLSRAPGAVRCVHLENEAVETVMTPTATLRRVELREGRAALRAAARAAPREPLLVTEGEELCGLLDGGRVVPVPVVPRTTSLGAAARALGLIGPCLIVADGERVVGAVTAEDLRRAGIPM
jgi:hypothetical protein